MRFGALCQNSYYNNLRPCTLSQDIYSDSKNNFKCEKKMLKKTKKFQGLKPSLLVPTSCIMIQNYWRRVKPEYWLRMIVKNKRLTLLANNK